MHNCSAAHLSLRNGGDMIDFSDVRFAERAFFWFLEVSKIPRGSGNTKPIADFLVRFAEEHGLRYLRDGYDNVIIKKPAARGYEKHEAVILQGHTDIVAEKTRDCKKDMETEGLEVYRDGDFLRARGTTLGADNGVALAFALAILENDTLEHPPIEALFTSDEETGLCGANGLDPSTLRGRRMINLDSDEEGAFVVGCAGGVRICVTLEGEQAFSATSGYRLTVSGLVGGHSGSDIARGRANAIKLLARVLGALPSFTLSSLSGGNKDNAIPREAVAEFSAEDISAAVSAAEAIKAEYAEVETKLDITFEKVECTLPSFDKRMSRALVSLLCELPFGVIKMSDDIDGLVETSMNLGIMRTSTRGFELHCALRSSKEEEKRALAVRVHATAQKYGAMTEEGDDYPGWEYKRCSPLRETMVRVYEKITGNSPRVFAIHAGLECGILSGKLEGLDCISMGPDNFDYHTTEERLSVPSFARVFEYLIEVLKNL